MKAETQNRKETRAGPGKATTCLEEAAAVQAEAVLIPRFAFDRVCVCCLCGLRFYSSFVQDLEGEIKRRKECEKRAPLKLRRQSLLFSVFSGRRSVLTASSGSGFYFCCEARQGGEEAWEGREDKCGGERGAHDRKHARDKRRLKRNRSRKGERRKCVDGGEKQKRNNSRGRQGQERREGEGERSENKKRKTDEKKKTRK